jgi:hypothetical protein
MPAGSEQRHRNAFTAEFLNRLDESGEPEGAHEADVAGPWAIRQVPYLGGSGFALLREWESLEGGDVPYAIFGRREHALLAAAVLPATGREPLFRLATDPDADGFPLQPPAGASRSSGPAACEAPASAAPSDPPQAGTAAILRGHEAPAGHLRDFDQDLECALNLAASLVRSPVSLARLLEAAGPVALEQVGRILHRRIR